MRLTFKDWFLWILCVLMMSCKPWSSETDQALKMAGENREELEKVLRHYNQNEEDSLKLKAAEYLISNMCYQYSLVGPGIDSIKSVYKYVYGVYFPRRSEVYNSDSLVGRRNATINFKYDIERISSSYLIAQIESAFETYNKFEWCREYSFDAFCRYILPYKIENSDTVQWRSKILDDYGIHMNHLNLGVMQHLEAESFAEKKHKIDTVPKAWGGLTHRLLPGDSNKFEMNFELETGGLYDFYVSYFNGHQSAANVLVKIDSGSYEEKMLFPSTGDWTGEGFRPMVNFKSMLSAGKHKLTLASSSKKLLLDFIDIIEYLEVDPMLPDITGRSYYITNQKGWIGVEKDSLVNETGLILTKNKEKKFPVKISWAREGYYQFWFEQDSINRKVLDAYFEPDSDWVLLYDNYGTNNQVWALIPIEGGGFQIRNRGTKKILAFSEKDSVLVQLPIDSMKSYYTWHLEEHTDSISYGSDQRLDKGQMAASYIRNLSDRFHWYGPKPMGPIDPLSILNYQYGTCKEESLFQMMMLRSLGVASAVDYVINWADRGSGHSWNVIFDQEGNLIVNDGHVGENVPPAITAGWKSGKVYRTSSFINEKSPFILTSGQETLPPALQSPYILDVTNEYHETYDIKLDVEFPIQAKSDLGYLMVYGQDKWIATGWGIHDEEGFFNPKSQVKFDQLEQGVMYLPVFYSDSEYLPINHPFSLDSLGNIHLYKVDTTSRQNLTLDRKYPNRVVTDWHHRRILGGKFQGANKPDFSDSVTIGVIDSTMLEPVFHTINVDTAKKFQYLRYMGPEGGHSNISEIVFFDIKGDTVQAEVIGTESYDGQPVEKAFDGDVLTYFDAKSPDEGWVGIKLEKPVMVSKIRFAARNDGNMVEVGDEYELVYWDKEWRSMGEVIATSDSVIYKDVPKDALYLLHNKTKGKEERPFTIDDNGNKVWW